MRWYFFFGICFVQNKKFIFVFDDRLHHFWDRVVFFSLLLLSLIEFPFHSIVYFLFYYWIRNTPNRSSYSWWLPSYWCVWQGYHSYLILEGGWSGVPEDLLLSMRIMRGIEKIQTTVFLERRSNDWSSLYGETYREGTSMFLFIKRIEQNRAIYKCWFLERVKRKEKYSYWCRIGRIGSIWIIWQSKHIRIMIMGWCLGPCWRIVSWARRVERFGACFGRCHQRRILFFIDFDTYVFVGW